ncbi:hypothetical protein CHISP_0710 [Chitinispirillum alkaliphilum]|nr:hypothetical protein CHISP_0710 [Chitinispirillum alkaliphilum]
MIPFIAALIGWFTNFIAVRMIFRPRKEVRFLGLRFMGLLPRRKSDLADKIADTVERELISYQDIRIIADSPEFHDKTGSLIKSKISEFIEKKIASNPLLTMFLSQDMTVKVTDLLVEEIKHNIPNIIEHLFSSLENNFNFRDIIRKKIEDFDIERLEKIVYNISSRELKSIEQLGAVLGFIVGIVQVTIMMFGVNA